MVRKHWSLLGICTSIVVLVVLVMGGATYIQRVKASTKDPDFVNYIPQIEWLIPPQEAPAFVDTFDDPESGWYVGDAERWNQWLPGAPDGRWEVVATMDYVTDAVHFDSTYHTFIPMTFHMNDIGEVDTWFVRPVHFAPLPDHYYPLPDRYCVQVDGYFSNYPEEPMMPWWATWGLVFGANEEKTEIYSFQINANRDRAALHYEMYEYPGNRQPLDGTETNIQNEPMPWSGNIYDFIITHKPNTLKVAVIGNNLRFWVNGYEMGAIAIPNMDRDRVGVVVTSWETTPVEVQLDNFIYDPHCAEAWE